MRILRWWAFWVIPAKMNFLAPGPVAAELRSRKKRLSWAGLKTIEGAYALRDHSAQEGWNGRRYFWIRPAQFGIPSGKLIRYQGTLVDVTERRKLERQVLQQEEFRRRLLEGFPDLILVVDLEERYTFVSSRVRDLLG